MKKLFNVILITCIVSVGVSDLFAQSRTTVTGNVLDQDGNALAGVMVMQSGTGNVALTGSGGAFSIDVPTDATLEISFLGYLTQTVPLAGQTTLSVVLQNDPQMIEDVVVVGYGTMRRQDVTSAITTVAAKDLNVGVMSSPGQLLQGKVPGLVVTTSSDPNASPSLTLRGASTLRDGAMSPYYVVDGVPGVDIALVAADDIETIDIFRDATATAIYGSKAANGVIVITTKKGRRGAAHVSYNGYVAVESVAKDIRMATAAELREYARANNFTIPGDEGANTDWQKEVQRLGISSSNNLSVNGGGENSRYNVSFNYLDHQGVIRGSDMERITARALAQSDVLKGRLSLSLGVNASQQTSNRVPTGDSGASVSDAMLHYSPLQPVTNPDGSWFRWSGVTMYYNPMSMIAEDTEHNVYRHAQFTGKADLKIVKGLTLSANASYMIDQSTNSIYHSIQSQIVNSNGEAKRSTYFGNKKVFEAYANYQTTLADRHRIGAMAGYSWEEGNNNDGFGLTVKNFYNDRVKYYNLSYANVIDGMDAVESGALSTLRMISFYGRLNYSFDGKYNFQATVRRDGSSAFGANNRWATFPSVSAAWRLIEENFIKDMGVFSDLKINVGYGVSGNSLGFDAYTARQTYGRTGRFPYTDPNGVTYDMNTIGALSNSNPNLKWERTGMFNVGLSFGFFGDRLTGSVEYYDKYTSDLIYSYPVSTNRYPYGLMTANVGNISNKGVEVTLSAIPVATDSFTWNTSFNIAHNKNVVKKLSNQTYSVNYINQANADVAGNSGVPTQRIMEGSPIGQFYTYEWAGYDENGVSQFWVHDAETGARTGETTTQPMEKDQAKTGTALPVLTFGWNNTLSYKKLSLNMFFTGVTGNKIFNNMRAQYNSVSIISQGKNVMKEALTDQRYGDVNSQYPSDRYLENGSYLRLSNLTLTYDFGRIADWVDGLSIYASCNNVFTITGYKGTNPEVSLGGLTPGIEWRSNYYPHTRTYMLGLKVNF